MRLLTSSIQWPYFQTLWQGLNGQDWSRWPRGLMTCLVILSAALSALLVWVVASPDGSDATQQQAQQQDVQTQIQAQQARLHQWQVESTASAHQAMNVELHEWPTAEQSQRVVMALYAQAQRHGLQVDSFRPEGPQSMHGFESRPLNLRLHGGFAQIMSWSDGVFHQAALWVPEKWILTASQSGDVSLEALLHLPLRPSVSSLDSPAVIKSHAISEPTAKVGIAAGDPFSQPLVPMPEASEVVDSGKDVPPLRRWLLREMQLVGTFKHAGTRYALILTPAGLFRLATGDLLGNEGGRVIALEEAELQVSTPVKQADGQWGQRVDFLPIRQATQAAKEKKS